MYYICCKKGNSYGVKDTSDGVVEFYSESQIIEMFKAGLKIYGVHCKKKVYTIHVNDMFNELVFLDNKTILKLQLSGFLRYTNNDGMLTNFRIFKEDCNRYAICLRDLGITGLGWNPFQNSVGNIVVVCDNTLRAFDCHSEINGCQFWFEDDINHKIYKNIVRLKHRNYFFSPALVSELETHNRRITNKNLIDSYNMLYENYIIGNNSNTGGSLIEFYRGRLTVNLSELRELDLSNLSVCKLALSNEGIKFNKYNEVVSNDVFNNLVEFTNALYNFTNLALNNASIPSYLMNVRTSYEVATYFSYRSNYNIFLEKYLLFLRNYMYLKLGMFDCSFLENMAFKIANKFRDFIDGRGFEIFSKSNSIGMFKALCDLNPDFKARFVNDYIVDTSLITEPLTQECFNSYVKVYKTCVEFSGYSFFNDVYKKACLYYVKGILPSIDKNKFLPLSTFNSNTLYWKLRSFFGELVIEYGINPNGVDFNKFVLDCVLGVDLYCHKIGLPQCFLIQNAILVPSVDKDNVGAKVNSSKVSGKFYTKRSDGTIMWYKCVREVYKDDNDRSVGEWSFEKTWVTKLPENKIVCKEC